MIVVNKQARVEYEITDKLEAGIELLGHEVKSLRVGKGSLKGSYVKVGNGEAALINMHIHPYKFSRLEDYEPTRSRRLLLHKRQILKLEQYDQRKGVAIVPLRVYYNGRRFKVEIGVGRGKKQYEKREEIKKRDIKRETQRSVKARYRG